MPARLARTLAVALPIGVVAACGSPGGGPAVKGPDGRPALRVVATTTQAGDFARAIGGGHVTVREILRPGVDPHDYEPSPADITAIAQAQILVANGVGLEHWLDGAVSAGGFDGKRVVMADGITPRHRAGPGSEDDPHIWHDPRNAKVMVADIERGFAAVDPAHTTDYQANLRAYDAKLDALDRADATAWATVPAARRTLVTNHDALGYYCARYGVTFVGSIIPSFDTSAELSGAQIAKIVHKIKHTGTQAVFSESSVPPKTAQAIARSAGVKVEAGEDSLYADSLGPAGSAGATYLAAEKHNTDVMVGALR